MQQFDICRLKGDRGGLVVLLQHEMLGGLTTRIVAPLSPATQSTVLTHVRIEVDVGGTAFVVEMDRLAAVGSATLGPVVGSLELRQDEIKRAIDFLFYGF